MKTLVILIALFGLSSCGATRVLVKKNTCQSLDGTDLASCELEKKL